MAVIMRSSWNLADNSFFPCGFVREGCPSVVGEMLASAQGLSKAGETGLVENRARGGNETPARWSVLVSG